MAMNREPQLSQLNRSKLLKALDPQSQKVERRGYLSGIAKQVEIDPTFLLGKKQCPKHRTLYSRPYLI